MKNVKMTRDGNTLTIVIDLSKEYGRSQGGQGKNIIVATTEGNQDVPDSDGDIKIGLNVYKRP